MIQRWCRPRRPDTRNVHGFTIVELLIVIIVIGILATLTLIGYSNVQATARTTKVSHDLRQLNDAILVARSNTGKKLMEITGTYHTSYSCWTKPTGTNLADKTAAADCWTAYQTSLNNIAAAANVSLPLMTDPLGRPYMIDENEGQSGAGVCAYDRFGEFATPFVSGINFEQGTIHKIQPLDPSCQAV